MTDDTTTPPRTTTAWSGILAALNSPGTTGEVLSYGPYLNGVPSDFLPLAAFSIDDLTGPHLGDITDLWTAPAGGGGLHLYGQGTAWGTLAERLEAGEHPGVDLLLHGTQSQMDTFNGQPVRVTTDWRATGLVVHTAIKPAFPTARIWKDPGFLPPVPEPARARTPRAHLVIHPVATAHLADLLKKAEAERDAAYRLRALLVAAFGGAFNGLREFRVFDNPDAEYPDWPITNVPLPGGPVNNQIGFHFAPGDVELLEHMAYNTAQSAVRAWDGSGDTEREQRLRDLATWMHANRGWIEWLRQGHRIVLEMDPGEPATSPDGHTGNEPYEPYFRALVERHGDSPGPVWEYVSQGTGESPLEALYDSYRRRGNTSPAQEIVATGFSTAGPLS